MGQILTHLHKISQKYNEKYIDELWPCFLLLKNFAFKNKHKFFKKQKKIKESMARPVYMGEPQTTRSTHHVLKWSEAINWEICSISYQVFGFFWVI